MRSHRVVIFCLFIASLGAPTTSGAQSAWGGALRGLGEGLSEIARQQAEKERILEIERQRAAIWAEQEQRRIEQAAELRRQEQARIASVREQEENRRKLQARQSGVTGTGFFITDRGHILTNAHVIADFQNVFVRVLDGQMYQARVIRKDATRDLALLVIERSSDGLIVRPTSVDMKGEEVFAIGFPMPGIQGQESKITNGIVSSLTGFKGRPGWMQISVPIQGGNSGGPLLSVNGDVVGVVVASVNAGKIFDETGDLPQNINYAIRSEQVLEFLRDVGIKNTTKTAGSKSLKYADANTVLIAARDMVFSGEHVKSPPTDKLISEEEQGQIAFNATRSSDDPTVLREFIKRYPGNAGTFEIKRKLDELDRRRWHRVSSTADQSALKGYLADFPDGVFYREALKKIREIDSRMWGATKKMNSPESYRAYLESFPAGQYSEHAKLSLDSLDSLEWEHASRIGSSDSYRKYMLLFPNGRNGVTAKTKIALAIRDEEIAECRSGEISTWGDYSDRPAVANPLVIGYRHKGAPVWFSPESVLEVIRKAASSWSQCGVPSRVLLLDDQSERLEEAFVIQWDEAAAGENFSVVNWSKSKISMGPAAFELLKKRKPNYPADQTLQMVVSHEMGALFGVRAHSRRCVDVTSYYHDGKGGKCFARDVSALGFVVEYRSSLPTACDILRCQQANGLSRQKPIKSMSSLAN